MSGIATVGIKVMAKKASEEDTAYKEIGDVLDIPELGGKPEKIDVTTLKDKVKKSINGVKDLGDLEFSLLYGNSDADANYRVLETHASANDLMAIKVIFPDKMEQSFQCYISVSIDSSKVNDAIKFKMSCALQTDISVKHPS